MKNKLWTKDFTIVTISTTISMLGNAMSGFAIGLMVLDYTQSVFLYSLFIVGYNFPKVIMPILAGPYIDLFSRKKVLYTLDFISAVLFVIIGMITNYEVFNYLLFLSITILIGSIDGIYRVAYDSLFPTLVEKENYQKAFSIYSVISPLSTVMIPIAAILYESIGLSWIFLMDAVTFLIAAILETQIKGGNASTFKTSNININNYIRDFKEGVSYIICDKGLLFITIYFAFNAFAFGTALTIVLPYFKVTDNLGVVMYTFVMAFNIIGRILSGLLQYRHTFPKRIRFKLSIIVYSLIAVVEAAYLFTPLIAMIILCFISGFLSIIANNIKNSSTQEYVPDYIRGRYNGAIQMINTLGNSIGVLLSGALAEIIPLRYVLVVFMSVNIFSVYFFVYRHRDNIKLIYNK